LKALVTGGTGFIGRRLIQRLLDNGTEIVALTRNKTSVFPEEVKVIIADIQKSEALNDCGECFDVLYHLAALVTFDIKRREELIRVNGQGTLNVLKLAKKRGIKKTVIVSSACTMGISSSENIILDESSIASQGQIDANPYLESKLIAETYALEMSKEMNIVIVNPTTVYGLGDKSLNSGTLIMAIKRSKIMLVPSGGSNDVDVDDVVEGIVLAAEKGKSGRRYILGGTNMKFTEKFELIAGKIGHRPIFMHVPSPLKLPLVFGVVVFNKIFRSRLITPQIVADMFDYKYYSSELANKELGWYPRFTFEQSIERAWNYYKLAELA